MTVRRPAAAEAAAYCKSHPALSVGIHFDFGEWIYRDQTWIWVDGTVDLSDQPAAAKEVFRQLHEFRNMLGRDPSHIDSHQFAHRSEPVSSTLLSLARDMQVPLRHHSEIAFCGEFYGQTSKGLPFPEGIAIAALVQILAQLPAGYTELRCHPGDEDKGDALYGMERAEETRTLCDPRVRAAIAGENIKLSSFAGFKSHPVSAVAGDASFHRRRTPVAQRDSVRHAETLWGEGHLRAAHLAFDRVSAAYPNDPAITRSCHEFIGELKVVSGSWKPPRLNISPIDPISGRILHVVANSLPFSESGYALRTHYIAKAQLQAGLAPHVVTPLGFPWNEGIMNAPVKACLDGIPHHRLLPTEGIPSSFADRMSGHLRKLADLVCNVRPALLHAASDYPNALVALEIGRTLRLPVVYEVRGFWEDSWLAKAGGRAETTDRYRWWKERELECMFAADRVVTLAQVMKERIVEQGVPAEKIVVIPNGVDKRMFTPMHRDSRLADQLGIESNTIVLGCISTFSRYEGLEFLLEAVARLISRGQSVCALLVGDGEERSQLEAYATSLGISERTIFAGRIPHAEILSYYGLIDIFVVPRTTDRVSQFVTPLKPFEAMATGRAVIVSGVPALKEIVHDGVTGLVFTPEDSHHLAELAELLIVSQETRRELGQRASDWVREHRMWDSIGELYRELYQSMGVKPGG
jgi:glycosyltransferase involved in cell wall biosynthesis/predicted glycoside hydrolase/deacetylase ChbG (UPF0249 family)